MPPQKFSDSQSIEDFRVLPEEDLAKLSLDRLAAYYDQLVQWETAKAEVESQKRHEAYLRLVERRKQERQCSAQEKAPKKGRKEPEKDAKDRRTVRFDNGGSGRSSTAVTRKDANNKGQSAASEVDQSRGIDPRLVFSCVEIKYTPTHLEKRAEVERKSPSHKHTAELPKWKNDGQPLPYVKETIPGIAYPATAFSPIILYLEPKDSYTPGDVAADKAKARRYPNNYVHSYTVAKDGCIYYNSVSWRPSRERCISCIKEGLHCWRRVVPNAYRCLRCNFRKGKCEDESEAKSSDSEDAPSDTHEPSRKVKGTKRRRPQEEHSDEEPIGPPRKRQNASVAKFDQLSVIITLLEGIVKESARHHAALKSLITDTLGDIHGQEKQVKKDSLRERD